MDFRLPVTSSETENKRINASLRSLAVNREQMHQRAMQQRQGQIQRLCLGGKLMASSSLIPFPLLPFRHPPPPPPPTPPPPPFPPTYAGVLFWSDFILEQSSGQLSRFPDEKKSPKKSLKKSKSKKSSLNKIIFFVRFHFLIQFWTALEI